MSVTATRYYVVTIIFHRRVWHRALSLRYACIRSSSIILIPYATFVPNFVSFAAAIPQLAHGEKSRTHSITHPDLMCTEPKLAFRKIHKNGVHILTNNEVNTAQIYSVSALHVATV